MTASKTISKKKSTKTNQPAKKATGTKGVFSTLPIETYQALKEKFPHCSTNQAVSQIIESHLNIKSKPRTSTTYRLYKCTHPATNTVISNLNQSDVARVLGMKRPTLAKHLKKAKTEGHIFTINGWAVTY